MEGGGPPAVPLCREEGGKRGGGKKRRFSDAQLRSLECTFESQAKPEPRRKAELAGELGLQPRQVAVWFQNRRARWKSKQLESEYAALRADYDALLSDVEAVRKEKQSLAAQLQSLTQQLGGPEAAGKGGDAEADGGSPPVESSAGGKQRASGRPGEELVGGAGDAGVCFSDPTMNLSAAVLAERQAYFDTAASSFSEPSCGGAASGDDWWGLWPLDM